MGHRETGREKLTSALSQPTVSAAASPCTCNLLLVCFVVNMLAPASLPLYCVACLQVKRLQGQVAVAEAQISTSQGQTGEVRNNSAARTKPYGPYALLFHGG